MGEYKNQLEYEEINIDIYLESTCYKYGLWLFNLGSGDSFVDKDIRVCNGRDVHILLNQGFYMILILNRHIIITTVVGDLSSF